MIYTAHPVYFDVTVLKPYSQNIYNGLLSVTFNDSALRHGCIKGLDLPNIMGLSISDNINTFGYARGRIDVRDKDDEFNHEYHFHFSPKSFDDGYHQDGSEVDVDEFYSTVVSRIYIETLAADIDKLKEVFG